MRYSTEPWNQMHDKGYGFLSFAKIWFFIFKVKIVGKIYVKI